VACAAALAVLDVMTEEGFFERAHQMGEKLVSLFGKLGESRPVLREIRAKGLMIGIELMNPVAQRVVALCREKGLLTNAIGEHTIRLLPPLIVSEEDIQAGFEIVKASLDEAGA